MSVLAERDVFNWIVGIQPIGKVSILNVGSYGLDAPPPPLATVAIVTQSPSLWNLRTEQ